jgi:hypothetical protein
MKNKIYNFLWFKLLQYLVPIDKKLTGPARSHKRTVVQLFISNLFGGAKRILLGDSEIAQFNTYKTMSKFSSLTVNLGFGGSTPLDWYDYFTTTGARVLEKIKPCYIEKIFSIGGNCSLKSRMDEIPSTMINLHSLFSCSWILLLPPIHNSWLEPISKAMGIPKSMELWKAEMDFIRHYQNQIWAPFTIDTYHPFIDPATGEAIDGMLRDMVHFSELAVDIIEKVLDKVT